jgi:hypothetical protein
MEMTDHDYKKVTLKRSSFLAVKANYTICSRCTKEAIWVSWLNSGRLTETTIGVLALPILLCNNCYEKLEG